MQVYNLFELNFTHFSSQEHIVSNIRHLALVIVSIYTYLQNKRMRRCGVAPPTNNFRKTSVTPTNYISSEREFIGESESSKILGKYFGFAIL